MRHLDSLSLWRLAAGVCAAALAPCASAQTLSDAVDAALRTNPTLESARLSARAEHEARVQARAAYLPQVSLSAGGGQDWRHTRETIFPGAPIQDSETSFATQSASLDIAQEFYTGGRRSGQLAGARARGAIADEVLRSTQQDVILGAIIAYSDVIVAGEVLDARQRYARSFETRVEGVASQVQVGVLTRTDLAQTQTRRAVAQTGVLSAEADLERTRAAFEEIIGARPEGLAAMGPPPAPPPSLAVALEAALSSHPLVLQAAHTEELAAAQYRVERSALLPQVGVSGRFGRTENAGIEDFDEDAASVRMSFSLPLYEGGYARSRMRESRLVLQAARADTAAARRSVARSVTVAWSDLTAARQNLDVADERVSHAREALAGVEQERAYGLRSVLDVLNAEDELLSAELAHYQARSDLTVAAFALRAAMGTLSAADFERSPRP